MMRKLKLSEEELNQAEPVFLLTFSINTGDAEYYFDKVVKAATTDEAGDKARDWMREFWSVSTNPHPNDPDIFYNHDRSVSISLSTVKQVTTEQLIKILSIETIIHTV